MTKTKHTIHKSRMINFFYIKITPKNRHTSLAPIKSGLDVPCLRQQKENMCRLSQVSNPWENRNKWGVDCMCPRPLPREFQECREEGGVKQNPMASMSWEDTTHSSGKPTWLELQGKMGEDRTSEIAAKICRASSQTFGSVMTRAWKSGNEHVQSKIHQRETDRTISGAHTGLGNFSSHSSSRKAS